MVHASPFRSANQSLLDFCYTLLGDRNRKSSVRCSECGTKFQVFVRNGSTLNSSIAINHAYLHLGKYLFSCRHCGFKASNKEAMRRHLLKTHEFGSSDENYDDISSIYSNEAKEVLVRCFGQLDDTTLPPEALDTKDKIRERCTFFNTLKYAWIFERPNVFIYRTSRKKYIDLFRHIFESRGQKTTIECFQCGQILQLLNKAKHGFRLPRFIDHACMHLKLHLFSCRHCDMQFATKCSVAIHIRMKHNLSGTPGNYEQIDAVANHHEEVFNMLKHCFENPQKILSELIDRKRKQFR